MIPHETRRQAEFRGDLGDAATLAREERIQDKGLGTAHEGPTLSRTRRMERLETTIAFGDHEAHAAQETDVEAERPPSATHESMEGAQVNAGRLLDYRTDPSSRWMVER